MEEAPRHTLLTLFNSVLTVYTIKSAQTVTCMPIYTVREDENAIGNW